jgi:soluble P-type ATPase
MKQKIVLNLNKKGTFIKMYRNIIPNELYFSKQHGLCVVQGHKVHHHQLVVVLKNDKDKIFHVGINKFDKEFEKICPV